MENTNMDKSDKIDDSWMSSWEGYKGWRGSFYDDSISVREHDLGYVFNQKGSTVWGTHVYVPSEDPQKQVLQLRRIRDSVHGLLRVHGLLENTSVSIANVGSEAVASAGFKEFSAFTEPYIKISSAVLEDKAITESDVLDVYCGLGLHEASHINHTRRLYSYRERMAGKLQKMEIVWLNLLEDERIEDLVRLESPGFIQYLVKAKLELFDKKELGSFLKSWDISSDLDKINAIFFSFIRAPHMLEDVHKTWLTVMGISPYVCLSEALKKRPTVEDEVITLSKVLQELYLQLNKPYEDAYKTLSKELGDKDESPSSVKSGSKKAKEESDKAVPKRDLDKLIDDIIKEECPFHDKDEIEKYVSRVEYAIQKKRLSEIACKEMLKTVEVGKTGCIELDVAKEFAKDGKVLVKHEAHDTKEKRKLKDFDSLIKSRGDRADFGRVEIERMLRRFDVIDGALSEKETHALAKFDSERFTELESWSSLGEGKDVKRRTVITFPTATDLERGRYNTFRKRVASQSSQIRKVFNFLKKSQQRILTEQTGGVLHRKMLSRARSTDKLFKTNYESKGIGAHICVLMDESGSMGSVRSSSDSNAFNTMAAATCLVEGLQNVKGVTLEVYSHTSCGESSRDCLIKYLYGPEHKIRESLGAYNPGFENYDHRAIEVVLDRMKGKVVATRDKVTKMMIVISDGSPQGFRYTGPEAALQVKKAVLKAKAAGVYVVQVAIGGHGGSKKMYDNVVVFEDIKKLTTDLRKLVQRIVK